MKKTELLIPVGDFSTLDSAIKGGADAVYLGGKRFGARAYANNFDETEMVEAIKMCHTYGVKVYVTINTMIYNEEFNDVIDYINFLYINNVDAVILQDFGLIHYVRKTFPLLDVHVSTQAHVHNNAMTDYYYSIGCKRVVFDREMSLDLINSIDTPIEKEVFVFGALCVCYSGNCLFSALNGGRSANRGMCVGSCRLPYKLLKDNHEIDNGYLLSTKDLNTLPRLKEILDSGIDSLKIEGRMKSKEYVYVTTSIFRKMIDDYYDGKDIRVTDDDIIKLKKTYNRGYTEGYLFNSSSIINKETSNHQGIPIGTVVSVNNHKIGIKLSSDLHQGDAIRFGSVNKGMYVNCLYNDKDLLINNCLKNNICYVDNKERIMYKDLINSQVLKTVDCLLSDECEKAVLPKRKLSLIFEARLDNNIKLTVSDDSDNVTVFGTVPSVALNRPVSEDKVLEQLSKLGNTPYFINESKILMDDNLFINLKDLNELRRDAINKLLELKNTKRKTVNIKYPVLCDNSATRFKISILVRTMDQLNIALRNNIDYIYVIDKNLYDKYKDSNNVYLVLPRVNDSYAPMTGEKLLCTEYGSVFKYAKDNIVRSSYGLNIANDESIKNLSDLRCNGIGLSLEFDDSFNIGLKEKCEMLIYGRPLCMIIKNNIFNNNGDKMYLVDQKDKYYPVVVDDRFTYIYNNTIIDKMDKINKYRGVGTFRIDLFDEDAMKTQLIISKLKNIRGD